MIKRRIKRDSEKRGYDKADVLYKYENHVLPSYKKYILPFKKEADIIIYSAGTQHSSLYPSYISTGLSETIANNKNVPE